MCRYPRRANASRFHCPCNQAPTIGATPSRSTKSPIFRTTRPAGSLLLTSRNAPCWTKCDLALPDAHSNLRYSRAPCGPTSLRVRSPPCSVAMRSALFPKSAPCSLARARTVKVRALSQRKPTMAVAKLSLVSKAILVLETAASRLAREAMGLVLLTRTATSKKQATTSTSPSMENFPTPQ